MQISSYYIKRPDGFYSGPTREDGTPVQAPSEGALLLFPLKTTSIHSFSFPFRSAGDVRNALSLKFRSLLSGEEEVEMVPFFTGRTKSGSEGAALCLWSGEIPGGELDPILQRSVVWPLPLALAGAVDGNGAAVYRDDYVCASAVFKDGMPVNLNCRDSSPDDGDMEGETRRAMALATAAGMELSADGVWSSDRAEDLLESARETVTRFPRLTEINISRPALAASLARERTARLFLKFLGCAAAAGVVMCIVQFTMLGQLRSSMSYFADEGIALYQDVFGKNERVVDPLSQAKEKLAALRGHGKSESDFSGILAHMGRTWLDEEGRKDGFPLVEQLRYTGETADITGTAEKMESIQALRTAADSGGFRATLGDIQQIPGGGLRFTLSLRRSSQ
ncbi:MAG: type II secretion system protein GspL [Synergistota bacterium]|nr:type II secretion system protein GspL [Synergistota bacterium]